jgi:hypothetical protein
LAVVVVFEVVDCFALVVAFEAVVVFDGALAEEVGIVAFCVGAGGSSEIGSSGSFA